MKLHWSGKIRHCCTVVVKILLLSIFFFFFYECNFSCLFKCSPDPIKFNQNTLINLLFLSPETCMSFCWGPELLALSSNESRPVEEDQWRVLTAHTANYIPCKPPTQCEVVLIQTRHAKDFILITYTLNLPRVRNVGRDVEKFSFSFKNEQEILNPLLKNNQGADFSVSYKQSGERIFSILSELQWTSYIRQFSSLENSKKNHWRN